MNNKYIVIKVGGSLLSRSEETLFDYEYADKLKNFLKELTSNGYNVALNVGGGFITRKYMNYAREKGEKDTNDLHKIGVSTTNLNAELLHARLDNLVYKQVIRYQEFDDLINSGTNILNAKLSTYFNDTKVILTAPSRPGLSNDWNAVQMAKILKTGIVFDLKDVDGVYTADPNIDFEAERIDKLSWEEYFNIIGTNEHKPGAHYPLDPIAAKDAKESGIKIFILHGYDFEDINKALNNLPFEGSIIG
ncbi:MAG: hypothetical protein Q9M76_01740 [Candidatus Dojkabacteria bacterium]|nr:hypothetical protein [Candidatus Dojkabacteria bacterium]